MAWRVFLRLIAELDSRRAGRGWRFNALDLPGVEIRRRVPTRSSSRHGSHFAATPILPEIRQRAASSSGDDAVHLEHLGVLAIHVDAVGAGDVPDILGVRVAAMLL